MQRELETWKTDNNQLQLQLRYGVFLDSLPVLSRMVLSFHTKKYFFCVLNNFTNKKYLRYLLGYFVCWGKSLLLISNPFKYSLNIGMRRV